MCMICVLMNVQAEGVQTASDLLERLDGVRERIALDSHEELTN